MQRFWSAALLLAGLCLTAFAQAPSDGELSMPRTLPPALPPGPTCPPEPCLELVEFRDLPLSEALQILGQQSKVRAVASDRAGKTNVSAYLKEVHPIAVLESLARANNLYLREDGNGIISVYTAAEHQTDLSSFREEQTEVFTLLYPNAFDVGTAIRDLYGPVVRLTYNQDDSVIYSDLQSRFNRFDLLDSRSQSLALFGSTGGGFGQNSVSGVGGIGTSGITGIGGLGGAGFGLIGGGGIGTGGVGTGGVGTGGVGTGTGGVGTGTGGTGGTGTGVAGTGTDGQPNPPGQQGQNNQNVTIYVTVIRRLNQIVVRTSDCRAMANISQMIRSIDVPTPLVLLEVKVLSIDLSDEFRSIFDYQFASDNSTAGGISSGNILPPLADIGAPPPQRFQPIGIQGTGLPPPFNLQPSDLIFQIVNRNFRFRVQLLESQNRVTEVATPMILTANNEVSRIFVGQNQPITVGFTSGQIVANVATTNTLQPTPITSLQPIGTQLLITPNINADRTVTLRITQQTSSVLTDGGRIPLPNPNGGFTNVPVDVVRQRTFSGTVVAKDGLMVAIGGLIEEGLNDIRQEPPGLGAIPYLGYLFRRQVTTRTRREQVILIRPYVFFTPVESASLSRDLMSQLSIHPMSPEPTGSLNTFLPRELLRPNPPQNPKQDVFKIHKILPRDF